MLVMFLGLSACAGSPDRIALMSTEGLQEEDSYNLCNAYAVNRQEKVKAELILREEIPLGEWQLIENKEIRIGMSRLGLVCSWGYPGAENIKRFEGSWGLREQWVYGSGNTCRGRYVYIENGKISGLQD